MILSFLKVQDMHSLLKDPNWSWKAKTNLDETSHHSKQQWPLAGARRGDTV